MISYVGKEERNWKRGSPEKERRNYEIMVLRLLGKSYREIGTVLGIHHSRVGQIVKRLTIPVKTT